ncbi:hypothetical protein DDB_G0268604 [Dictyostelium discoideum AX4]|uniref:Putative uncharacterized protein DDB_G0268604 n=1 Tax=Dictyostelium discoideum TaxID=44689 RepID=Y6600_DICDI|nr:hypothetical protein DDB_G0268604 [Dictyostelium discoideum AX4]Q55F67.1 RecName: Full=Putative uncharacterized protein DDB_G0268604 [Dictyostelium discoideum]EAL73755.1 hypothetical protein DDB_G0268604 [Dictyostelium discoideum AX4]|eukprot:XP_647666.1 hypothetical protein DDB_G0268604 [Dictyostelium discoideum AX4]
MAIFNNISKNSLNIKSNNLIINQNFNQNLNHTQNNITRMYTSSKWVYVSFYYERNSCSLGSYY